jgi:hypothetical protein
VAETEWLLLAGKACRAWKRYLLRQEFNNFTPLAIAKRIFQLDLAVEMILDYVFIAPRNKNEVFDAGFASFVDNVLNERPVNDRQHFLWHCLGGWEKSGTEARDREDRLADRFHRNIVLGRVYAVGGSDREVPFIYFITDMKAQYLISLPSLPRR